MRQISHIVPMKWMIGLNFEDASNTESAQILGKLAVDSLLDDNLLYSIQIGNEPDLYAKHGVRKTEWGIEDYTNEWMTWATQLSHHYFDDNDKTTSSTTSKRRNIFTGGVICCTWQLQDLLDSGYFERSKDLINSITVQKYSSNACFGVAKGDISDFTSHSWITSLPRTMYEEPAKIVIENNKELIMGETNSAACRGIQGISDTYVSALWSIDWQLFLYSIGFSSVELQLGGSTSHYNPMSKVGGSWIVNPIYYGSLVTAEALGPSDAKPQVVHIEVSSDSRAAYAIFHQQALKYIVLINLNPDEEAVFSLQSSFTESWWNNDENGDENNILKVKRLTADSLQEKHVIQWAGQTLHGVSDGLLRGDIEIDQVKCNDPNQCEITLPKGSVALVGQDFDEYHTTIIADHSFDVDDFLGVNNSYNHENNYNFTNPLRMAGTTTTSATTTTFILLPSITSLFISISLVTYYMFIII
ncbi:hypothetical protein INT45_002734 [Circinella minor]|uniref:Beta-glucuronidase C-terminal domain-containing protein n=1 Tax=Circinella minor TaxID=1195481 RepID=A0A8H7S2V8_9FUNG|nr:hypothetical protein INT45_002734 [Circinella minor]